MIFLETIRCEAGYAHHLDYHQKRLDRTCRFHGISKKYDLKELIAPPDSQTYRCRFLYSHKGFEVEYIPYAIRIITKLKLIEDNGLDYSYKYADRKALDRLFQMRGDADDIIITKNGLLTDTSIANIALCLNGQWFTPTNPLLKGTTRERLMDQGIIQTADLTIDDLERSEKIALMNAMIGFAELDNGIIH